MKKLKVLMIFIFMVIGSNNVFASECDTKSLVTTWNVPYSYYDIIMPLSGDIDVLIDWGDGSEIERVTEGFPVHEYKTVGEYDVIITGKVEEFGYFSDIIERKSSYSLLKIKQWGEIGATRYGFLDCLNLKSVETTENDIDAFKNVTDAYKMFYGCESLEIVDLSKIDTSSIKNMSYMFYGCESLKNVNLIGIDTSNVADMSYMFYKAGGWNLYKLDLSNWDISSVINTSYMFYNCYGVDYIILNNWDFSNVENLSYMFGRCLNCDIEVEKIKLKNATDISYMFWNAGGIKNLVIESDECINVNMTHIFYGCDSLEVLDLTKFKVKPINSLKNTFYECKAVAKLDLSGFETSCVKDMSYMFYNCNALKEITLSDFDASQVTNMSYMFYECNLLENVKLISFTKTELIDMSYMFYNCKSLEELNFSCFDSSNVENFSYLFFGCEDLENINFDNFDTSNATNMSYMFAGCRYLESLDLLNFNTENVIYMNRMFEGCSYLSELDLSSFNTSNVIEMTRMFADCVMLKDLILISFDTTNVKKMDDMFYNCSNLKSLDLESFNIENATNLSGMFFNCESLEELKNFKNNIMAAENTSEMFKNCKKLVSIDFKSMDVSNVIFMTEMFYGCKNLSNFNFSTWNTENVRYMKKMFYGCTFETIDISNFDTSNVEYMESMFGECNELKEIDLSMLNTQSLKNAEDLISGQSLEKINLSNWNLTNCYKLSIRTGVNVLKVNNMLIGENVKISLMIGNGIIDARGIKGITDMDFSDSFDVDSDLIIVDQNVNNLLESIISESKGILIVSEESSEEYIPKMLKVDNNYTKLYLLNQELADLYKTIKGYKETFGEDNILPLVYLNNSNKLYIKQGERNNGTLEDGFFIGNLKLEIYYTCSGDDDYVKKMYKEIEYANEILSLVEMKVEIDNMPIYTNEMGENEITYKITDLKNDDVRIFNKKIIICGTIPLKKNIVSYNYTGNEQRPILEEIIMDYKEYYKTLINFECMPRRNAGEYELIISLKDKEHYCFEVYNYNTNRYKETSEEQKIFWNIQKSKIAIPNIVRTIYDYNGNEISIIDKYDSSNIIVSGEKGINAGNYILTIMLKDKINYMWTIGNSNNIEIDWNIRKLKVDIPYVKSNSQYNGKEQTIKLKNFDESIMNIANGVATEVGTYEAVISLKDKNNYEWKDGTTEDKTVVWEITEGTLGIPMAKENIIYSGIEQEANIVGFDEELMNISGNVATNAGTYKAVISLKDKTKYKWSNGTTNDVTIRWKIQKADCDITVINRNFILGNNEELKIEVSPKLTDGKIIFLCEEKNNGTVYNENQMPSEEGLYKIKIQVLNDKNINDTTKEEYILIEKKSTTTTVVKSSGGGGSSVTTYKITVNEADNGKISPSGIVKVEKNNDKVFKIIPNDGYKIKDVLVDGKSVGAIEMYIFESVTEKHTIEAHFEKVEEKEVIQTNSGENIEELNIWKNNFLDITPNDWYYEAVKFVNEEGLFKGVSNEEFGANTEMTRAMLVTVLYRLAGEPSVSNTSTKFNDIENNSYYEMATKWANSNAIVTGMSDNTFAPNSNVTREQLVVILYRYAKYINLDTSNTIELTSYEDINELSNYAKEAMEWAVTNKIITGRSETTLVPKGTGTRAEVATILMRFSNMIKEIK